MARYTEAVCHLCRRQGEKLFLKGERCFSPKCAIEQRNNPPGQHTARRRKVSERGLQLREKQKARWTYGVLERQFRRHYQEAARRPGATGENLLQELELRLDNVVYRLGFADSRAQARQIVQHGHIALNGRKTNIPSARVKTGNVVSWVPASMDTEYFKAVTHGIASKAVPSWLSLDMAQMAGRILTAPSRQDIDVRVNEQAIVEWYSR
ncbi:MAG: 30S ribosomal protein S4 [Chloroflexi bacterium]|nr:30S ribosomal protein S4 [Chloroflexota bacterium]